MNLSHLKTLQQTLNDLHTRSDIAISNDTLINGKQMQQHIFAALSSLNKLNGQHIALYFDNSYSFCIMLMALLCSDKTPVILPNAQTSFIDSIAHKLDHIISDTPVTTNVTFTAYPDFLTAEAPDQNSFISPELNLNEDSVLLLFTSGSTGQPKKITKTLAQLEAEFKTLEALWGDDLGQSVIRSTVSHQHIYGLIFRLLWPLCAQRCFDATTYPYPEKLFEKILTSPDNCLISSPAHLKRIPELVDLKSVHTHLQSIFSSGGALDNASAQLIKKQTGVPVTEVFGSTETGGVAHRQQSADNNSHLWQVFKPIRIKLNPDDNTLLIHSPFEGSGSWYSMQDIVCLHTNTHRFEHLGRADSIVKIEEKRLSLTEMQNVLTSHQYISACAPTVVHGKRKCVAMVAVLNPQGQAFLLKHNKLALNTLLKKYLNQHFEAVVLPRKWRYTTQLPANAQGKMTQQNLQDMFNSSPTRPKYPLTTQQNKISDEEIKLALNIPENLHWFDGHYPDQPIVPGVIEIDWAIHFSKTHFNLDVNFRGIEALKFHELIEPNDDIFLHLTYKKEDKKLHFNFTSKTSKLSSGRILL